MAYLALYREWRPRKFKDMVGQEHVTRTLLNALTQDKIAHAYLFSGPRGTGKTTAAKILAKALNCEERDGLEPCNQCSSCTSIDQGTALEVFEIDAASNRGIDEIRDLRDKVRLSAAPGKYKVYIIDEVHMLTTEAFNALLKTLEEPPSKVIFILATTEVHKIPLTILSRVQRFEFHRISAREIQARLQEVCQAQGRDVDQEALATIAQKSEGGLRDALSILDQCLLLDDPIGNKEVYDVLGMVGETYSAQIVDALINADYGETLSQLTQGIEQGRDPRQILRELLDYLRQLLLYASAGQTPMVANHLRDHLYEQSQKIGLTRLLRWISVLLQGEGQLKYAGNARLAAELLLVQTIYEGQGMTLTVSEEVRQEGSQTASVSMGQLAGEKKKIKASAGGSALTASQQTVVEHKSERSDTASSSKAGVSLEKINQAWPQVLEEVRRLKKSTHAFLLEGKPGDIQGDTLTLVFRDGFSFHKDKVNQDENRKTIENVLQGLFGVSLKLTNIMEGEFGKNQKQDDSQEDQAAAAEKALIKKAEDIFGRDLVIVKDE